MSLSIAFAIFLAIYFAGGIYITRWVNAQPYISATEAFCFLALTAGLWAIASAMITGLAIALLMTIGVL